MSEDQNNLIPTATASLDETQVEVSPELKRPLTSTERSRNCRARQRVKADAALAAALRTQGEALIRPTTELEEAIKSIKKQSKSEKELLRKARKLEKQQRAERRALRAARKIKEQQKVAVEDALDSFDSEKELVKIPDIRAFHSANPRIPTLNVQEQLAYLTLEAAKIWGVPANRYAHKYGSFALEAREKNRNLVPEISDEPAGGAEVLSRYELFHLYDRATLGGKHEFAATLGHRLEFSDWLERRNQFSKDPAFACQMTEHPVDPEFHNQLLEFLPQWNFDGLYPPNYTLKDFHEAMAKQPVDSFKEFLLLVFRSAWKSTLVSVICAQLICAAPDVRIGLLSGSEETAADLLKLMKSYFLQQEGAPLSDFQRLFPEFVVRGQDLMSDNDLLIPARKHFQKEPSLWSGSPKQVLASKHVEVLVLDDVVSATTSGSPETRATLHAVLENAKNLVDSWGLVLQAGTPWTKGDYWDERLEAAEEDSSIKTLIVPAWVLKPESREKPLREVVLDDVEKFAWEKQAGTREKTFQLLRRKIISDEASFRTQQLIQWTGDEDNIKVVFTEDQIRACTKDPQLLPPHSRLVQVWDSGYRDTNKCDRSAGICAGIFTDERGKSCLLIRDLVADRFKPSELGFEIAAYAKKWLPAGLSDLMIERVNGSEWLDEKIQTAATQKLMVALPIIYWRKVETGPLNKNIKKLRIQKLELLMEGGRLFFSSTMGNYDRMLSEFVNCDLTVKGRKLDILDAISRATEYLGADVSSNNPEMEKHLQEAEERRQLRKQYDMIFNGIQTNHVSTSESPSEVELGGQSGQDASPIHRALNKGGFVRDKSKPVLGFGYMNKRPIPGRDM